MLVMISSQMTSNQCLTFYYLFDSFWIILWNRLSYVISFSLNWAFLILLLLNFSILSPLSKRENFFAYLRWWFLHWWVMDAFFLKPAITLIVINDFLNRWTFGTWTLWCNFPLMILMIVIENILCRRNLLRLPKGVHLIWRFNLWFIEIIVIN
jgi:hypothetical protein